MLVSIPTFVSVVNSACVLGALGVLLSRCMEPEVLLPLLILCGMAGVSAHLAHAAAGSFMPPDAHHLPPVCPELYSRSKCHLTYKELSASL